MITRSWNYKGLHFFVGSSSRWGIELTWDVAEPALTIHIFNIWLAIEVW